MAKKKLVKLTPLYNQEGKESLLPGKNNPVKFITNQNSISLGRHQCLCEASKHSLISNCLACGRIVCEQEGTGECFTCGTFIFNKKEREELLDGNEATRERIKQMIDAGMKLDPFLSQQAKSDKLSLKQIAASFGSGSSSNTNLDRAVEHKNKLLEYDASGVARSKVYDDQVDYFTIQNQNFISTEARKQIQDRVQYIQENKFNKEQKVILDLENLTITDTAESVIKDIEAEHRTLAELSSTKQDYEMKDSNLLLQDERNAKNHLPAPVYIPDSGASKKLTSNNKANKMAKFVTDNLKVQDWELDKIEDRGMCLAMHQPYASLLVAGIKRFEGRSWYTPFRGRLWIYANARITLADIKMVETFYGHIGYTNFPSHYPTASIVGCVNVIDCLPLEVYQEQYPEAEIDSPYALICEYPITLVNAYPVVNGGGGKIYKLDSNVHKACKDMLGF